MALIKCKKCGQMISDKASRCPKCGNSIMQESVAQQNANMNQRSINQQPVFYDEGNSGNSNKWLYGIFALLFAVLVIGGYCFYSKIKQQDKDYQQKLVADSIARDSIAKVEEARLIPVDQAHEENTFQSVQPSSSTPIVHYVVIGSFSSLQNAIEMRETLMYHSPEWLSPPPIFSAMAKGKVVYRLCSGIFKRKDDAKERASFIKNELGIDAWIWKSNGLASCVDRPIDDDDRPVDISPH